MNPSVPPDERRSPSEPSPAPAAGPAASERRSWASPEVLAGLVLLLAVVLVYQPVRHAGYIWDDDTLLTANPCIVGPLGLKEIWTTKAADLCPLTITTFWAEHKLWGLAPLPYHLVNVLLHAAGALLLWRVLRALQVPGAWLGAALWALHPVQVESVAWIAEMKNTESGVFYLLAILCFLRPLGSSDLGGGADRRWRVALTWLCAALAMASKTSTMVLPVVLCLLARWQEGHWCRRTLLETAPVFLLSIAAGTLSVWTQALHPLGTNAQWARSGPQRLATAGDAVWFYLGKLAWPHPLMMVYPRWEIDARWWPAFLPLVAAVVVGLVLWRQRRAWRTAGALLAGAIFLVALSPVLGLVEIGDFRHSFVFDHFQYLASMGPLALAGAGIAWLLPRAVPGRKWLPPALGAGLLLTLGLVSWQRCWAYESQETLWKDTLAKNPHCWVGYGNLGLALLQKRKVDEAITQYRESLKINPFDAQSHNNLGNALRQKRRVDEAIVEYRESLQIDPGFAPAHNNLGNALKQNGRLDEAIVEYREAIKSDPVYVVAHNNLGVALLQKGRVEEAFAQYQKALQIDPDYPYTHYNLGIALAGQGRLDEAVVQFQEAIRLKPGYGEAQRDLAVVQAAMRPAGGGR